VLPTMIETESNGKPIAYLSSYSEYQFNFDCTEAMNMAIIHSQPHIVRIEHPPAVRPDRHDGETS
jgi:hypothetical protein